MFTFFTESNLISPNQSRFRTGNSCINQLLSIIHEIYELLDVDFEVKGTFLDISAAFGKVWHEGWLLKLNRNGISGDLLKLLRGFLPCRKQSVDLNSQHSCWDNFTAGIPQVSILVPLLFLTYINDLPIDLSPNCKIFIGDTSLFSVVNNNHTNATFLSQDLNARTNWAFQWKMIFNPNYLRNQAQEVILSNIINKSLLPTLLFNNIPLKNNLF